MNFEKMMGLRPAACDCLFEVTGQEAGAKSEIIYGFLEVPNSESVPFGGRGGNGCNLERSAL